MFYISYSLVIILHMSSWYSTVHYKRRRSTVYAIFFTIFYLSFVKSFLSRLQFRMFVPSAVLFVCPVYRFVCLSCLQFCLFVPSTVLFVCPVYRFVCLSCIQFLFCLSRLQFCLFVPSTVLFVPSTRLWCLSCKKRIHVKLWFNLTFNIF